ncbi:sterol desaturase family protein [Candidatus Berkiella aquae]|uniref:Fatty acid hydroxylase superfamily protein n=1 Tax=Candidatus Berkiella aquae TaxID=295108 RepID=A0A0Q9YYR1_9GAMM|nr:sterol desaturase family protein [Candidatus Berkiella aquae]MCS5712687.1 sterol desaturase family protein [Candidatus Berkiella aquae]
MEKWIVQYQDICRLLIFIFFFLLLATIEKKYGIWRWADKRSVRWTTHLSLALISKVTIRLIFPFLAVTTAWIAQQKGIGYFNQNPTLWIIEVILSMVFLDLVMYTQHLMMHRIKAFWRVHRVHHMDRHLDVSTGIRFHPIEEMFTMGFKLLAVAFIGAPVIAVFLYEILLNVMTMFVHMNVYIQPRFDKVLRLFMITPNMHRIHHSDYLKETNSNYGFCLSIWDKLFGTYTYRSISGDNKIYIGLEEFRYPQFKTLPNMLLVPFNPRRLKVRHRKRVPSRMKS